MTEETKSATPEGVWTKASREAAAALRKLAVAALGFDPEAVDEGMELCGSTGAQMEPQEYALAEGDVTDCVADHCDHVVLHIKGVASDDEGDESRSILFAVVGRCAVRLEVYTGDTDYIREFRVEAREGIGNATRLMADSACAFCADRAQSALAELADFVSGIASADGATSAPATRLAERLRRAQRDLAKASNW